MILLDLSNSVFNCGTSPFKDQHHFHKIYFIRLVEQGNGISK